MKHPIILKGPTADWEFHKREMAKLKDDPDNFSAAMGADPGVIQCPACKTCLWREGWTIKCPDCSHEFETGDQPRPSKEPISPRTMAIRLMIIKIRKKNSSRFRIIRAQRLLLHWWQSGIESKTRLSDPK